MTGGPIEVPWNVLSDYRCFGCSPRNEHGLRLRFERAEDGIACRLRFDRSFESYPGMVHGGVITTVCDEIMGKLLVLRTGVIVLTTTLRTRFVSSLAVGQDYRCVAGTHVRAGDEGPYRAWAEVHGADGTLAVTAAGQYQPVTAEQARERITMTDAEAQLVAGALALASSEY
ncbi:PaaI family thioesterase [Kutzneria sp. CA-103260]|uniref:PaaI family thioesterase n=1 Tax=Kutzneria sp. CA-103260 TaxID=2802641 RepID=UPI001BA73D8B|nr:PaaI family thioesterase [Kutzneria sp. CA-103260]QUQ64169.1 hypothetical protein JJ691_18890 [Kutzneria sp. CA-103260]